MSDFIIQNVPSAALSSVAWSSLTNAAGSLTLSNGTNTTEFDQTSSVTWKWKNTTTATSGTTNASPVIDVSANYWTGAASAEDAWTIGSSLAAGTNGASTLTFAHSGSTGTATVSVPNLQLTKIATYNAIATVSGGVPAEYATSDLTAQSAAITATTLYATAATGMYRVSWSATITTADGVSSVLGGTNGFQVLYTSPTDSVVKTTVPGASVTSAANTTGTAVGGCEVVYAKTGTNIQFQYGYTSATPGQMVYEIHIKVEAM
jgi:hypothetical protein